STLRRRRRRARGARPMEAPPLRGHEPRFDALRVEDRIDGAEHAVCLPADAADPLAIDRRRRAGTLGAPLQPLRVGFDHRHWRLQLVRDDREEVLLRFLLDLRPLDLAPPPARPAAPIPQPTPAPATLTNL